MRVALIKNDVVENVIIAEADYPAPDGYQAVPSDEAGPGWTYAAGMFAPPPAPEPPPPLPVRSVPMWRARTIMKVTPWGAGTLFEAVQAAIAGLTDPLQKASAEEALERGDVFDRDGMFVPMLAGIVGISDEQMDDLLQQAAALPA